MGRLKRKCILTAALFCTLSVGAVFLFGQGKLYEIPKTSPESRIPSSGPKTGFQSSSSTAVNSSVYTFDVSPNTYYHINIEKNYETCDDIFADIKKYTKVENGTEKIEIPHMEINPGNHKTYKGILTLNRIQRIGQTKRYKAIFTGMMYLT